VTTAIAVPTTVSRKLWRAIESIAQEQLPSGEIPNYRKLSNGTWEYCFSPAVSAYVHNSLAVFDPLSEFFNGWALEQTGQRRMELSRTVSRIRRNIRRFLAWQQAANGTWKFYGHASSLPPDLETTAICALALLDRPAPNRAAARRSYSRPFLPFPRSGGLFASPNSRGRGETDPILACIANLHILRYQLLTGAAAEPLASTLSEQWAQLPHEDDDLPPLLQATAHACACFVSSGLRNITRDGLAGLLEKQAKNGEFGGPLNTALALSALVDAGYEGQAVALAVESILGWMDGTFASKVQEYCDVRCASPAFTSALAAASVARAGSMTQEQRLEATSV
jgi:hypothetical protein